MRVRLLPVEANRFGPERTVRAIAHEASMAAG
jgi:hypothetical protein